MDALMPFPPIRRSIQLPNGAIDAAWQQWATAVFQRLGESAASSITVIESEIAALSASDAALDLRVDALESAPTSGFTYSTTAPVSPSAGDRWVDANSGIEYTYLNDGNSMQWVEL